METTPTPLPVAIPLSKDGLAKLDFLLRNVDLGKLGKNADSLNTCLAVVQTVQGINDGVQELPEDENAVRVVVPVSIQRNILTLLAKLDTERVIGEGDAVEASIQIAAIATLIKTAPETDAPIEPLPSNVTPLPLPNGAASEASAE